jgi:hypothetical protein
MSGSGGLGQSPYIPPLAGQGTHPLADPSVGSDDHHAELPEGRPRNLLGNVALLTALAGVVLVWALQDSLVLIGFVVSGAAFVAGAIALFLPGRRRTSAIAALVIGAAPFLFTAARVLLGF